MFRQWKCERLGKDTYPHPSDHTCTCNDDSSDCVKEFTALLKESLEQRPTAEQQDALIHVDIRRLECEAANKHFLNFNVVDERF